MMHRVPPLYCNECQRQLPVLIVLPIALALLMIAMLAALSGIFLLLLIVPVTLAIVLTALLRAALSALLILLIVLVHHSCSCGLISAAGQRTPG
jgi:hypothetical protein